MKKQDIFWIMIFVGFSLLVVIPTTRFYYETFNQSQPYFMGFIKTMILASLGERLVSRFKHGVYFRQDGFVLKAIVWGLLGMVFVLIFPIFHQGVIYVQTQGFLPGVPGDTFGQTLTTAFLTSLLMNLWFAPTFMLLHRITDAYIELSNGDLKRILNVSFKEVLNRIDFNVFFKFVILKTIPLFWIPAHTITFLLPGGYRVLFAAYLSIALGIILTLSNFKKKDQSHDTI